MQEIKLQSESGKPVLGICNGAQILVETGLIPGLENNKLAMALTENKRIAHGKILGTGYYNAWVHMRLAKDYQRNAFTKSMKPTDLLYVPIAHAQGRFVMTEALLQEIKLQGLNVFQYCDAEGKMDDHFPVNPNGSIDNIAAISNKAGNVMAMMPHPERTENGDAIFQSMRQYITEQKQKEKHTEVTPLYYYPRRNTISSYQKPTAAYEYVVELMITDNQALTVQNTLQQLGLPVIVKRYAHWEIACDSVETLNQIKKSGVLYNNRKEIIVTPAKQVCGLLVRAKEDLLGQEKLQTLQDHFSITDVKAIRHGVLWHISAEHGEIENLRDKILQTNIIGNPFAHDYYDYTSLS